MAKKSKKTDKRPRLVGGKKRALRGAPPRGKRVVAKPTTKGRKTTAAARSTTLPGFEQVRNKVLDNACEQIAEGRGFLSRGHELEHEGMGIALQEMAKKNTRSYKHAGVEIAFVPGVDKIRVRLTDAAKDTAKQEREAERAETDDLDDPDDLDDTDHPDDGEGAEGGVH